jgi:thiol:disulfide interchange protein
MNRICPLLALCAAIFAANAPARAQSGALPDAEPKVHATLIPEKKAVAPGETVTLALHEAIRKGWHTYYLNPGDSGAPTEIKWMLAAGWKAGAIEWPYPERLPVGPLMNFGYEDAVTLLVPVTVPKEAVPGSTAMLAADVNWLVCSDVCIPEETHLTLGLPVVAVPVPPDPGQTTLFADARARLPRASPFKAVFDAGNKRFVLLIESAQLTRQPPRSAAFFPAADGFMEAAAPQAMGLSPKGLVLETSTGWKMKTAAKRKGVDSMDGILMLTIADGRVDALDVTAKPGIVPAATISFAQGDGIGVLLAIAFAFLGGLILNLMPCVLPVLSMKALALAKKANAPHHAKVSAIAYGLGALASFLGLAALLLGLRAAGQSVGWGFQLQQPLFVATIALLMFAVGLNLSGVFEVDAGTSGIGHRLASKAGATGSFFTGVLAVVVATPCTAPFMGAAMGYALGASTPTVIAVFASLALGFAFPFMLLGLWPRALKLLPRPGAWMATLRQVLAFPMYGAAIWLIWVLAQQSGSDGVLVGLSAALALAVALWAYGRSQHAASANARLRERAVAAVALVLALITVPNVGIGGAPPSSSEGTSALDYEPYSAAKLASLREEGRPVFVNATAAWCITCLVNERVALSSSAVEGAFAAHKVAALKADWTNGDPEITALLAANRRDGVPLYLYYAPGAPAPKVLPQLLTQSSIIAALGN